MSPDPTTLNDSPQSARDGDSDDNMYWCIKCRSRHRRNSSIGSWHSPLERPELDESNVGRSRSSKPEKSTFAAAIALALELHERDATEVRLEHYQQRYPGWWTIHTEGCGGKRGVIYLRVALSSLGVKSR